MVVLRRSGVALDDPTCTVDRACERGGLAPSELDAAITREERRVVARWDHETGDATIDATIDAIVRTYHERVASELDAVDAALARACPSWETPHALLAELRADLAQHLEMEERVLFPLLASGGRAVLSTIRSLSLEHGDLIAALLSLGSIVRTSSDGASELGAEAARAFARFETHLCENLHVETTVLFPRALGLACR